MALTDHNGRTISSIESGAGVSIVLLPPGASPAAGWRPVADILSSRFRTIAVNPSGYAETDRFSGARPMSLDDEAEAVIAVLADDEEPAHLVGHSYGGAIAIRLVLKWPDRFATLTLVEPAVYPLLREAGERTLAEEVEGVNDRFIERVGAGESEPAFRDYFDFYNGTEGAWLALPDPVRRRMLSISGIVVTGLTAARNSPTRLRDCASISMPTVLIRGAETDPVHTYLTDLLAREIPRAHLKIVDGAGHMLSLTHPAAVARLISRQAAGI